MEYGTPEWFTDGIGFYRYTPEHEKGYLFTPGGLFVGLAFTPRSFWSTADRVNVPENFTSIRQRLKALAAAEPDADVAFILSDFAGLYC